MIRRLSSIWLLNDEEEDALLDRLNSPTLLRRGQEVVAEGSRTSLVHVLAKGVACRYRMLADGKRQIVAFLLPGDIVDLFSPVSDVADHSVSALSGCEVTSIHLQSFRALIDAYPNLSFALWRYSLSQCSILQGWLTNMRRRSAAERLAHLFCEQFVRLNSVGLAEYGQPFRLNIAQGDLADAAAISSVHVNRTLQQLRKRNLIGRNPVLLEICDWEALREFADFDQAYLHLREPAVISKGPAEYGGAQGQSHSAAGPDRLPR